MSGSLNVNLDSLFWNPTPVTLPEPVNAAGPGSGGDPMSLMVSAIAPGLADEVKARADQLAADERTFSEQVSAAKGQYQSADEGGAQTIGRADQQTASSASRSGNSAAGGTSGAGGGMGQLSSLMGPLMQAPSQVMQAAGALPQTAMQVGQQAAQQVQQLAGQTGKGGVGGGADAGSSTSGADGSAGADRPERQDQSESKTPEPEPEKADKDKDADKDKATSGKHSVGSAPLPSVAHPSSPAPRTSGRHAADPVVDM